jgi:AraC-like DNA-binding protein
LSNKKFKCWNNGNVEIALLDCTDHHFPKHYHDEFVLGVNLIGGESIWLDGREYEAGLNEITLYNPGEMQSSSPLSKEWKFISIYFDDDYVRSIFGFKEDVVFEKSVISSAPFAEAFRQGSLNCLSETYDDHEVHEFILLICDGIFRRSTTSMKIDGFDDGIANKIKEKLLANISHPLDLSHIAEEFSLSSVQLVRMFKKTVGISPFQWLKMQKLHSVKKDLLRKKPIADLAFKYGFADQAHLTRHFKKVFGVTPGTYQKALNSVQEL